MASRNLTIGLVLLCLLAGYAHRQALAGQTVGSFKIELTLDSVPVVNVQQNLHVTVTRLAPCNTPLVFK